MDRLVAKPKPAVLLTGASGFVGSYLGRALTELGYPVTALSRSANPAAYKNISWSGEAYGVHLAETNNVATAETEGAEGIKRAIELAEKLVALPVSRWVYLSSAAVYGDQSDRPHRETDAVHTDTAYARQKIAVEKVFLKQGHSVVRSANLYGVGMSPLNVLSRLLSQLPQVRKGSTFHVKTLTPVRDYLHVTDLCQGIAKILASDSAGIFNLGTGKATSVGELCAVMAKAAGLTVGSAESESAETRASYLVLDPEKAKQVLGWSAQIRLDQGILELLR